MIQHIKISPNLPFMLWMKDWQTFMDLKVNILDFMSHVASTTTNGFLSIMQSTYRKVINS